jgi:hypothetical protein
MEKLFNLLRRLQASGTEFRLEPIPYASGIRVHTWAANERWEIDFLQDGEILVDVYRAVQETPSNGEAALEGLFGRMAKAWLEASRDLGFEFVSPFALRSNDGRTVNVCGWLPHFGSVNGTIISSRSDPDEADELAEAQGYYTSGLAPRYYETYDRQRFMETLSEWGWFGPPDARPAWVTAK